MDLDDFIITAFCIIDDTMKQLLENTRLRQRGRSPRSLTARLSPWR